MHVKLIFDIIQNGRLAAILDVNTLGAVTRTTPTRFLSNLVQRESLGGPTCMPIYLLFDFKNGDMAAMFFGPHDIHCFGLYLENCAR